MSKISGRPRPRTDAQWARTVEQRLNTLEAGNDTMRVGQWVLSVDTDGELIATTSGRRVVLTVPTPQAITNVTNIVEPSPS